MNLRDLQYIVAIDEQGHFGRAAEACNVSQPTLSGQVAKLEAELDIQIFQRVGRKVQATEAGREIITHARRTLAAAQDISAAAQAHRDPLKGKLRLGVIPTLGPYLMPFLLPLATKGLPKAPLILVEDMTDNVVPMVVEGKLDAALIATEADPAQVLSIDLFDEPFWIAAPANHPLAAQKEVNTADIDPQSLLLLTDGHCLRDQTLDLCQNPATGEKAMADMRATSLETLLHLTAAGYGITLAPQLVIECGRANVSDLVIRPLKGEGTSRRVRLIYRRGSPRATALIELARIVRQSLPESVRRLGN
ncbi:MAG: LysR family transcriptional regulator [Hyphomicrobiales bacterium]|nr:LysR family transcriptional regulator [Hyphomicrobiales bacterium]